MLNTNSQYVLEFPELVYDCQGMIDFANSIDQRYWIQWISDTGVTAKHKTCELKHFDLSEHKIFSDVVSRFNPILGIDNTRMSIVKFPEVYELPVHLDPIRLGAIILPLYPENPAPIYWNNESGEKVYEHVYVMPTAINVQKPHGVVNDGRERMTVQIDLMISWDEFLSMYSSNDIVV